MQKTKEIKAPMESILSSMDHMIGNLLSIETKERNILCDVSHANKFMVTKFVALPNNVKLVDIQGDVVGVTGYTKDEFIGKDIMELLGLDKSSIAEIIGQVEHAGVCSKDTIFRQKNGNNIQVRSTLIKVATNTYVEFTVPESTVITL